MTSPYKEYRGCSISSDFFSFQTKPVLLRELKPSPSQETQRSWPLSVFSSQVRRLGLLSWQVKGSFSFPGFVSTHPCGSQSMWSQLLSLPFSLLGLFLERFPPFSFPHGASSCVAGFLGLKAQLSCGFVCCLY